MNDPMNDRLDKAIGYAETMSEMPVSVDPQLLWDAYCALLDATEWLVDNPAPAAGKAKAEAEAVCDRLSPVVHGDTLAARAIGVVDAPSIINGFSLSKAGIVMAGRQHARALLDDGGVTPLSAYIKMRALRDALDVALDELAPVALDQAEKDPGETLHGVGWQVRNGATTYGYDHDAAWSRLKASEQQVAEQRKAREKFLRALDAEMVDPATGEFVAPAVVKKPGAPTLALMFPKV